MILNKRSQRKRENSENFHVLLKSCSVAVGKYVIRNNIFFLKLNGWTEPMMKAIRNNLEILGKDPDTKVAILTGKDPV